MMGEIDENTTHFGYRQVPLEEKTKLVEEVFISVAPKYDLMNDLMSLGLHRLWKRFTLRQTNIRAGQKVLDVAAGTGDIGATLSKWVGPKGKVIFTDINESMLMTGRDRLTDQGILGNVLWVQADAEQLPFPKNYFDCICIAFGLRNVTNKNAALQSMYHVLKPGGKFLLLEFSHPTLPFINQLYEFYSFNIIPKMGEWVAHDRDSYQYLVESIRMHPNQEELKLMMLESGFEDVEYFNLTGGIVALHTGYKY